MQRRDAFARGDQRSSRDVQYATSESLDDRARLHREFATASMSFHDWEAALLDWPPDATVLECRCGNGRFREATTLPRSMRLTLTDRSPGMVSEAVERVGTAGFASVGSATSRTCPSVTTASTSSSRTTCCTTSPIRLTWKDFSDLGPYDHRVIDTTELDATTTVEVVESATGYRTLWLPGRV